ncbi:CD151 antigen [Anthonomus grandis grandis]|uniref:CD151 antigen n=1 Tax=Anthonomus grandis grandis TaxID=2921223 RepID=UPI0021654A51|nr:CD151 antigen [Anthonomus grandis grandis]
MGASNMDGCGNFMKYSLFFVNLVIFGGGIIASALGIWILADKSFANELLGTNLYSGSAYVLVITGILVVLISCLGCLGSIKEIRCMLVIYFTSLFLIFVTMLIGGILGYIFREKVEKTIRLGMDRSLSDYRSDPVITAAWDNTQKTLECCGVNGYDDWKDRIPDSCCRLTPNGKPLACQQIEEKNKFTIHLDGCLTITKNFVKNHALIIGTAGVVLSSLLILGMIFSCALFKLIK